MNDRFKFRFWNKSRKIMETFNGFSDAIGDILTNEIKAEPYIIMQCTGLKDKNKKLIYEGDVVQINGWWDASGPAGYDKNICVVEWDNNTTGFTPMCNYDCDCWVYHNANECEVIGNIYENAELLMSKDMNTEECNCPSKIGEDDCMEMPICNEYGDLMGYQSCEAQQLCPYRSQIKIEKLESKIKNLAELVSWQGEKLEKIKELCKNQDILRGRQALATTILKIIRGEE